MIGRVEKEKYEREREREREKSRTEGRRREHERVCGTYRNMIMMSRLRVELSTFNRLVDAANSFTVQGNERAFGRAQFPALFSIFLLLSFSLLPLPLSSAFPLSFLTHTLSFSCNKQSLPMRMSKMLLPSALQRAISKRPDRATNTLVKQSGMLVPASQ